MPVGDIRTIDDLGDLSGRCVLVRTDINSPIDPATKAITDTERIRRSAPTLVELAEAGAKVVVLAHQGDPIDFQNFTQLAQHAEHLADAAQRPVGYIEDVVGPAALARVGALQPGEILLLENVRWHTEETVIFEKHAQLDLDALARTTLPRRLAPLADCFVMDAFACVHRAQPTTCGLAALLPSACGRLFEQEYKALERVRSNPDRPCVYVLGGAKVQDAFKMLGPVLDSGSADRVLLQGLAGHIMLLAAGRDLGDASGAVLRDKDLMGYVDQAKRVLGRHGADKVVMPCDVAYDAGARVDVSVDQLPVDRPILDIGPRTIEQYAQAIAQAGTVFMNGPAGVYEQPDFARGTEAIWRAVGQCSGFTVIGGGDTIQASRRFGVIDRMSYVCTAGGGMVLFMSGQSLPVLDALAGAPPTTPSCGSGCITNAPPRRGGGDASFQGGSGQ
jgi:phosphoglycerate kinase